MDKNKLRQENEEAMLNYHMFVIFTILSYKIILLFITVYELFKGKAFLLDLVVIKGSW